MESGEYSRREFLRRFAMLSSAPLLMGLNTGCGSSEPQQPAFYGPPPVEYIRPEVIALYYIANLSTKVPLRNNQSVPVQVVCYIEFNKDMNPAAPVSIAFTDSSGHAVSFSKSWKNPVTLEVAPQTQLLFNTSYILSVGADAEDTFGNKIYLTSDAAATFKTVSA